MTPVAQTDKLVRLCVDILAHSRADIEWVSGRGNGTNPCEAENVALNVLDILGVPEDSIEAEVKKRHKAIGGDE